MNKIKRWATERLVSFICRNVVVGGHCGLCGKWVPDVLLPRDWPWTVCPSCCTASFEKAQQRIRANIAVAKLAKERDA